MRKFALVRDRELTIVGNGGADQPFHPKVCGEAWSDTAREQTNPDITPMMETCTGVTWMHCCADGSAGRVRKKSRTARESMKSM